MNENSKRKKWVITFLAISRRYAEPGEKILRDSLITDCISVYIDRKNGNAFMFVVASSLIVFFLFLNFANESLAM